MSVIPRSPFQTLHLSFISKYLTSALFLWSRKKGFANLLSVIVATSILLWFFTSFKLGNMFGVKDPIPYGLRTFVVYNFLWAGGTACYAGETFQHLSTRVREHLVCDRISHIFTPIHNSPQCRTICSDGCFSMWDHASTTFQLKIKEAIHIQWEQPTLNHQT